MKNVQITLPDDLARDAAALGLLEAEAFEALVRNWLIRQKANTTERALVCNAALTSQPALTAIWNDPKDNVYNTL